MRFHETLNRLQQKFNQLAQPRVPQQPCLDGHNCPEYWPEGVINHNELEGVTFGQHHDHYARYIHAMWQRYAAPGALPIGRAYLIPLQIEFMVTVDRIGMYVGTANGNIRLAIYHDNGDTPVGGALVVESGSVAAIVSKNELTVADTQLAPALYWICVQNDDATLTACRSISYPANAGTLFTRRFGQAYGAFTNPCPATVNDGIVPMAFVRVKSVP